LEGSAQALKAWGGEGHEVKLRVVGAGGGATGTLSSQPGEALLGVSLRINVRRRKTPASSNHTLNALSEDSTVRVRIADGCLWFDDIPSVSLVNAASREQRPCSEVVALDCLPEAIDGSLRTLAVIDATRVTSVEPLRQASNLAYLDLTRCVALTDLAPLASLKSLTTLNLPYCNQLTDLAPLAKLAALTTLNLWSCEILTQVKSLRACTSLASLGLWDSGNVRDLDALSECASLRELKWTETAAPHAVLAATAVLRGDAAAVEAAAGDWLKSLPLSKTPDVAALRLVHAFALGGDAPWAADALTRLAGIMRARAAEDDNPAVISPQTWAAWANAALALSETALAEALRAATTALNPERELKVVLAPLLTALADLGHAARPQPRRATPDWLLPTVRGWLAPIAPPAGKPEHARQLAPAAAVFFAGFGLDTDVRVWLEHGTHPDAP
jgi:hypothetical protein